MMSSFKGETLQRPRNYAPDYDDAAYWDAKFLNRRDVGEWLNEGDLLIERAVVMLEKRFTSKTSEAGSYNVKPCALHLGPGSSSLGDRLCLAFEKRGWTGYNIVLWTDMKLNQNVDFSAEAVRLGREREDKKSRSEDRMNWIQADLCAWEEVARELLQLAPINVFLDKSTSDAIATSVSKTFPYSSSAPSEADREDYETDNSICPLVHEILQQLDLNSEHDEEGSSKNELVIRPVELLSIHLALLAEKDAIWLALSYSSTRFDGMPYLLEFWTVVSRTSIRAPSGQASSAAAMVPDVFHWLYVLQRK